jgi:glycerol-3-phosphate dehydrogenase
VRYTTARHTAAEAIDAVFADRGQPSPPCATHLTPVTGGAIGDREAFLASVAQQGQGLPDAWLRRIALTHGTECGGVLQLARDRPELAQPLGTRCEVSGAEILHAVRHEAAVTLSDAVLRRTEAGSSGYPGDDAIANAAAITARELAWSDERTAAEVAAVRSFYRLPG